MSKFNEKTFKLKETFTNTNGKSSASGFIGVILGVIAGLSFIATMVGYFLQLPQTVEVMGQILMLVGASTVLLGVRKMAPRFGKQDSEEIKEYDNAPYLETEREQAETERDIKQDVIDAEKG